MTTTTTEKQPQQNTRYFGMLTTTGFQGVGKTYQNMYVIKEYIRDKPERRVKGRKCLIFDTNGEYTEQQFAKNGIPNFRPRIIKLSEVQMWLDDPKRIECVRIDAKHLKIKEKKAVIEYLIQVARGCMVVLEDINNYILSVTHMEEIVSGLINLRHRAVDVMVSYQGLRFVEPRIISNSRWVRFAKQAGNVMDIKGKLPNVELFKIAQLIVDERYELGDTRFFVYIHVMNGKIEGDFTKEEFSEAARKWMSINKKDLKEYMAINECSIEEAKKGKIKELEKRYYGNTN